jgi:hypothetical protein
VFKQDGCNWYYSQRFPITAHHVQPALLIACTALGSLLLKLGEISTGVKLSNGYEREHRMKEIFLPEATGDKK